MSLGSIAQGSILQTMELEEENSSIHVKLNFVIYFQAATRPRNTCCLPADSSPKSYLRVTYFATIEPLPSTLSLTYPASSGAVC